MLATLSVHEYVDMIVGLRYAETLPMMSTYMKLQSWSWVESKVATNKYSFTTFCLKEINIMLLLKHTKVTCMALSRNYN